MTELLPPSYPIVRGEELWFYYSGFKYRDLPKNADPKYGAVCLAVLRRDGFISLDSADQPGTLLSKPLVVNGTQLCVNVDAADGGLEVEVLDRDGKSLAVSKAIRGDQLRAEVRWKSGDLSGCKAETVRLRFTLRKAKLYSFWLAD